MKANPIVRRILTSLSTATAAVLAIVFAPTAWVAPAFAVVIFLVAFEFTCLYLRKSKRVPFCLPYLFGVLVIVFGLSALPLTARLYGNLMMLYVIAIVKVSDMGGFAFGLSSARLMRGGNHKLCPTVSPNKSWEGLFGSVFAACVVSCAFAGVTGFGWAKSLAFGVAAALVGTFGDLVESKFKRWVGVKDSATFMPAGLGGFLDMFDSLLFAPAALLPFV